ncbi:MAG: dockerin type I repeat-containing protein, partial [Oscillospiraceae bacterium]|nr:dockerin type I repeat-containing protein [Oscillospiraceae bacterium]
VGYVDNKKMVSMPENDSIPSLENLQIEQAKWLYFCTWYDGEAGAPQFISGAEYQNPETLKTLFDSDYCITLEELPENLYQSSGEDTKPTEKPTEKETSEKILYGDVDQNGEVDILDIITLNKNLLGKEEINETQQKAADVNLSGKPDIGDSTLILKFIVGLVKPLPDES